jgi:hypothetical protein
MKTPDAIRAMYRIFLFAAAVLSALSGCSRDEPEISFGFIELVYYQGRERPEERFSFFVMPENGVDIEDLAELYLFHDREGLRWKFASDDWISYTQDDKTWIGSRAVAMYRNQSLPRGMFRAELTSKGGERSERSFTFDAPEESRFPFPVLSVSDGLYNIESQYPENRFICYDVQGNYVSTMDIFPLAGRLSSLSIPDNVRTVALWAEDPEYRTSALTDVVSVRVP